MHKKRVWIVITIIFIIILLDQITKALVINQNITIIPKLLKFTYTENTGIAFSIGTNSQIIIIVLSVILLGIIIKFMKEKSKQLDNCTIISLNIILAGGISNLVDRIFRGYVVDFIDINLFEFPIFNLADVSITIGATFLIIIIVKQVIENKNVK